MGPGRERHGDGERRPAQHDGVRDALHELNHAARLEHETVLKERQPENVVHDGHVELQEPVQGLVLDASGKGRPELLSPGRGELIRQPHEVGVVHRRVEEGSGRRGLDRDDVDAAVFDCVEKAEGGHMHEEEVVVAAPVQ